MDKRGMCTFTEAAFRSPRRGKAYGSGPDWENRKDTGVFPKSRTRKAIWLLCGCCGGSRFKRLAHSGKKTPRRNFFGSQKVCGGVHIGKKVAFKGRKNKANKGTCGIWSYVTD